MKKIYILFTSILITGIIAAQHTSLYMPPSFKRAYEKGTRSWDGKPGPNYWQNSSKYKIWAEYDPATKFIIGKEEVVYSNNSPDTIMYFVTKLLQNAYKKGNAKDYEVDPDLLTDGIEIGKFVINGTTYYEDNEPVLNGKPPFFIQLFGTNLLIILRDNPIMPGDQLKIEAEWKVELPERSLYRTGHYDSTSFFAGYWYPQIAVYDDIAGFDIYSYTGIQETYNDHSDYEVALTLPASYLVWATGEQLNEKDVFTSTALSRIEKSKKSDEIIHIMGKDDQVTDFLQGTGKQTWIFKAEQVPDFAWAASDHFLWDATSLVVDEESNRRVWIHSVYPSNENDYSQIISYAREGIDYLSNQTPGVPFPYFKHITFHGLLGGGMEFPMMANNNYFADTVMCYDVTVHEIAHTYFPFYVGINERQFAWMDEGWVTIFGHMSAMEKGYSRERLFMEPTSSYSRNSSNLNNTPLMVPSSLLNSFTMNNHYYIRPVQAQFLLLDLMKESGIDNPLPEYINRWAGKHPTPYDFFFTMNDIIGEDLSWFWEPWYFEFGYPDLAIKEVKQSGKKIEITIEKKGNHPVPIYVELSNDKNQTEAHAESIRVWQNGNDEYRVVINTDMTVHKIKLGNQEIPDVNSEDNLWNKVN